MIKLSLRVTCEATWNCLLRELSLPSTSSSVVGESAVTPDWNPGNRSTVVILHYGDDIYFQLYITYTRIKEQSILSL